MKENKNNQSVYEEPELEIISLTVTDIIATSGVVDDPIEGEKV